MKPALLLLPNLLAEHQHHEMFLPSSVDKAVESLDGLISESEKGGRRFLSRFNTEKPAHNIPLALFNKNTPDDDIDFLLEPIVKGERWGYVSDAGLPCIADPGAKLVSRAQEIGLNVQAFTGPSSITLALMLSGLSGQNFTFHGYLPKDKEDAIQALLKHQHQSQEQKATQIYIEVPHHNDDTLRNLIDTLSNNTQLCVAWDLTLSKQGVMCHPISAWKKLQVPNLHKRCAIYLFQSTN